MSMKTLKQSLAGLLVTGGMMMGYGCGTDTLSYLSDYYYGYGGGGYDIIVIDDDYDDYYYYDDYDYYDDWDLGLDFWW